MGVVIALLKAAGDGPKAESFDALALGLIVRGWCGWSLALFSRRSGVQEVQGGPAVERVHFGSEELPWK